MLKNTQQNQMTCLFFSSAVFMSFAVKSFSSLLPNHIFSSLAGGFFSIFSRASLCRDIKSFQQSLFWCCSDILLLAFCFSFFFFLSMHRSDGFRYRRKPVNSNVVITWVFTCSGVLLQWEFPFSGTRWACEASNVAVYPVDVGIQ